jgi:tetratricopeptide (TPR) repeat protein
MIRKKIITALSFTAVTAIIFFTGCTKEVPKELLENNKQQQPMSNQEMPDDSIHRNLKNPDPHGSTDGTTGEGSDKLVEKYTKDADDADAKFQKTKSDADKKAVIDKQMVAANYLMFEADLPPKQKYRPALKRYNRVLEIDPSNKEAAANKKQIEDIYQQMGMPVPN